jgi:predicted small metal-binding protein
MALSIACKDMGLEWCDFQAHADNKDSLIEILTAHSAEAHDIDVAALMAGEGAIMLDATIKQVDD